MKKDDKASISLRKVISISIILLFIMGIGVMAAGSNLTSVKIIMADGYEMDVLTSKTKVSEILEENKVLVLPTEKVVPDINEEISDNHTIKIALKGNNSEVITVASEDLSIEDVMSEYSSVTEKVLKEQITVSYETETKDLSTGNGEKIEKVTQNGVDGLKEISYKVRYENGEEKERVQIGEALVKNPVNCIKEIRNKPVPVVTSRSSASVTPSSAEVSAGVGAGTGLAAKAQGMRQSVGTFNTSAYCAASCGGNNRTATGAIARANYTVASDPRYYPMGTIFYIPYFANYPNGGWFVAQDTGGAIKGNKLDVYMNSMSECTNFGRRNLEVYVYMP